MKKPSPGSNWFFVDESGDPTFYDKKGNLIIDRPGCSPILIIGFIETQHPEPIRQALTGLRQEIATDSYFESVPSITKTLQAFHAKDDLPEIRYKVFKLLASLEFRAQFIIARKIERVFRSSFEASETAFYDHLILRLFENVVHRYEKNNIYFAKRGVP